MSELLGPTQAVIITSRATIEQFGKQVNKDDIDTVFWHTPVSKDELVYAISVSSNKHITKLIETSGVFVVNYVGFDLEEKVNKCNLFHGEHVNKFKHIDFIKIEANSIECPMIREACAHLECQVINTIRFKDYTLFIAKIINSNVKYSVKRLFHLKNNYYTTTKDV